MTEAGASAANEVEPTLIAGRYRVLAALGRGGMGAVYRCEHAVTGRKCAVKRLHPQYAQDGEVVARFIREARIAGALDHPGIVEVLDAGVDADGAFLVMELLEGSSLEECIALRDRTDGEVCGFVRDALRALEVAHRAGIVHRDLKPANIFVSKRDGRTTVKLLDFGISKLENPQEGEFKLTRTGTILGTPYFMPPEQARGSSDVGAASDLYSMGVVMFQCLSGELPFDGPNYNALLAAILTAETPSLAQRRSDLPSDLVALVRKAMDRDPRARFASASAMAEALAPFCSLTSYADRGLSLGATLPQSGIRQTRASLDAIESTATPPSAERASTSTANVVASSAAPAPQPRSEPDASRATRPAPLRTARPLGGAALAALLGALVTIAVVRRSNHSTASEGARASDASASVAHATGTEPRTPANTEQPRASEASAATEPARTQRSPTIEPRSDEAAAQRPIARTRVTIAANRPEDSRPQAIAPRRDAAVSTSALGRNGQTIDENPFTH